MLSTPPTLGSPTRARWRHPTNKPVNTRNTRNAVMAPSHGPLLEAKTMPQNRTANIKDHSRSFHQKSVFLNRSPKATEPNAAETGMVIISSAATKVALPRVDDARLPLGGHKVKEIMAVVLSDSIGCDKHTHGRNRDRHSPQLSGRPEMGCDHAEKQDVRNDGIGPIAVLPWEVSLHTHAKRCGKSGAQYSRTQKE